LSHNRKNENGDWICALRRPTPSAAKKSNRRFNPLALPQTCHLVLKPAPTTLPQWDVDSNKKATIETFRKPSHHRRPGKTSIVALEISVALLEFAGQLISSCLRNNKQSWKNPSLTPHRYG
jgi:hypothetical protein